MKLATTMGIELTYCATAIQTMFDRGVPYYPNRRDTDGETPICSGLACVLRNILSHKKINFYACGVDPSCVEVSTKPYTKLETLINISERIGREAAFIGLTPRLPYTIGGGAHIHTGVLGKTPDDRDNYKRRMCVFAAKNPWLSWAFADIYDKENRNPIFREDILSETTDIEGVRGRICFLERSIVAAQREVHTNHGWRNSNNYVERISNLNRKLLHARRKYNTELKQAKKPYELEEVVTSYQKDKLFRVTCYGKYGTIEMRMFDMGDSEQLARQIKLADAIVRYVSQQTYTEIARDEIPTMDEVWTMPWRARRDGFINMLRTLGLDPDDYREERVRIAERIRYWRTQDAQDAQANTRDPRQADIVRAVARHQRRHRA